MRSVVCCWQSDRLVMQEAWPAARRCLESRRHQRSRSGRGDPYYTKALGIKEAFTFRDNRGSPLSYLQISRDTFLELQGATADRPPGLIHVGIEVAELRVDSPVQGRRIDRT